MHTSSMRPETPARDPPGSDASGSYTMTASPTNTSDRHPATNLGDDMLTLQEACRFLRVPEGTLRYWRHLGSGPRSFKIGRHVRYWRADLILWLTEQTNRPQDHR
jgi:predicted DNA-binding transcriptional regulator AlpA